MKKINYGWWQGGSGSGGYGGGRGGDGDCGGGGDHIWWVTVGTRFIKVGLVQGIHSSSALALELRLSCTNPSIYFNKSDGKHGNTLGCLDQCTCKVFRLWNSQAMKQYMCRGWRNNHETITSVKQSRYSWLSGGYMVVIYFQQWWNQKIWLFKSNLTLKVKVNCTPKQ